ncbi:MAG: hypothetical protein ACKV2O_20760 [Acidimicrobiales bacterium]
MGGTNMLWLVAGIVLGVAGYRAVLTAAPGRLIETHQAALIVQGGTTVQLNGPRQLSRRQGRNLLGVYDITDQRLDVTVDPVYAMTPPVDDAAPPERQRFFLEMAVVYRPIDMVAVLRLSDDIDEWLASHVRTAVRALALTRRWDPQEDGERYALAVRQRLWGLQQQRGIELVEVYCQRVGVLTVGELQSRAKGSSARNLGRDGLMLTYLEALRELATSPSTKILLPTELSGDPHSLLAATRTGPSWPGGTSLVDLTGTERADRTDRADRAGAGSGTASGSGAHDMHADDALGAP